MINNISNISILVINKDDGNVLDVNNINRKKFYINIIHNIIINIINTLLIISIEYNSTKLKRHKVKSLPQCVRLACSGGFLKHPKSRAKAKTLHSRNSFEQILMGS